MNTPPTSTGSESPRHSNRVMLCIAWLVVGIPLGWGVFKSVEKSLPLFIGRSTTAPSPSPHSTR